jgi:hypothetical protein
MNIEAGLAFRDLSGDNRESVFYSTGMSTVGEIIKAVKGLDEAKKGEFLEKLAEVNFDDAWDRQIEADANAGRLDRLWQEALGDIRSRRTKPLDEILNDE